jgi:small subunit ribosomal protein S5
VRTVLEVAGIENALSKSLGSSNRVNMAYAALDALKQMQPSSKWIIKPEKKAAKKPAEAGTKR